MYAVFIDNLMSYSHWNCTSGGQPRFCGVINEMDNLIPFLSKYMAYQEGVDIEQEYVLNGTYFNNNFVIEDFKNGFYYKLYHNYEEHHYLENRYDDKVYSINVDHKAWLDYSMRKRIKNEYYPDTFMLVEINADEPLFFLYPYAQLCRAL